MTLDRHSRITLLLIEDSAADSELVQALLEDELPGTQVTCCSTLAGAHQHLQEQTYDVVMADLSLPDAEGLTVVEAVRDADKASALLVLTGRDDSSLALAALAHGAQDYLVKGQHDGPQLATAVLHSVQRQRVERAAHVELQLALLDALEAPTCAVTSDSRIVAVNKAWRAAMVAHDGQQDRCGVGVRYLDVCGNAAAAQGEEDGQAVARGLRDVLAGRAPRYHFEYPFLPPDGSQIWFSVRISPAQIDRGPGAVITHVDVTELRRVQQALSHQVLHDPLTGLPNRLLLTDRLEQAMAESERLDSHVAVAFVDLDHFKRVNDTLGHAAGDALLIQVAARLNSKIRLTDTLARVSGDEFVVVWRDLAQPSDAALLSERLSRAMSVPFDLGSTTITVTASIGVAVGQAPQSPQDLLLAADEAMYDAKGDGRGRVRVFTEEMREDAQQRAAKEVRLRQALAGGELVLHYQPVVELATGLAVGVEALVRWEHPEHGLLSQDHFIPVAETSGLIVPLGRWVLEQACADAASRTGPLADLDVTVNFSARELTQPDVLSYVRDALASSGLEPQRLTVEVTETTVLQDAEAAGAALEALASLGVRIAIDDTGYTSLRYLRGYPVSALKIDRAFVSGLGVNAVDDAICASVVTMARGVGARSIAEGVQTPEQYVALRTMGCQQAQGWLWCGAVPLGQLGAALEMCAQVRLPVVQGLT